MEKHKNKNCVIAPKVNMDSKTLPDSTTCTLLVERNGEALKGGPDSVGGALCSKQFGPSNKTTNLQVSANTGPGNGLISEIFPDDFFENDTRLHGSTSLIINTDGSIHPYSQPLSQKQELSNVQAQVTNLKGMGKNTLFTIIPPVNDEAEVCNQKQENSTEFMVTSTTVENLEDAGKDALDPTEQEIVQQSSTIIPCMGHTNGSSGPQPIIAVIPPPDPSDFQSNSRTLQTIINNDAISVSCTSTASIVSQSKTDSLATPISQQFSLPLQSLNDSDGITLGSAQDLFTLTLTDGTTVQLRVQDEEAPKPEETINNENNVSAQSVNDFSLTTAINQVPCPPMVPLDPTIQPTTVEFPAHHQVVFNNFQVPNENSEMIEVLSPVKIVAQHNAKNSIMGAQREAVTIQDVDLSTPINEKHGEVHVEDFDDILKNIMDSADNSCSADTCSPAKEVPCSKATNALTTSPNINKDVTLQLAAPISTGDDDDVSKLNGLQTTLSSMSSYLSHLKTGLKAYDLPEPPTDAFDALTSSNFPDLLNYNVSEKRTNESSASKTSTKRNSRSMAPTSKFSKSSSCRMSESLKDAFDMDEDTTEMDDVLESKAECETGDFIDDELLQMFTSVHTTTIESLKARLMASRLPDGSSETDLGALLVAAKIDLTVDDIVTPPLNAVKKLMESHDLTDWQQTLCLKIRRRKKNTAAVRSSRRKRNQYVVDLRQNVDELKRRKKEALEQNTLLRTLTVLWERLCSEVEEELKEGINRQFNHKFQVDTKQNESPEYVYCSEGANIVFNQLSPPHENSTSLQNQPITIVQQPSIITYDPMTPPASIDQNSPNSNTLVAPIEIGTTVFQQPCITSSYMELPVVYENTVSHGSGQEGGLQSAQQTLNISYLHPQFTDVPIKSSESTSSSQAYLTTASDVVSSTKWITSSGTDNSSTSSGLSPLPSSPSAQLSPSPPHSPNSSHASSGGSPQLFISESKSVSPLIPSSQASPTSDIGPIFDRKTQCNTSALQSNDICNLLTSEDGSVSNDFKEIKESEATQGQKVVIQLQNHQLQQLKNQLNLFVLTNSKSKINSTRTTSNSLPAMKQLSFSNCVSSNVNIKEVDSTTDLGQRKNIVKESEDRGGKLGGNSAGRITLRTDYPLSKRELDGKYPSLQLVQNSNKNSLSTLKRSSNETTPDFAKGNFSLNMRNNVFLKVEDEFQDEITPNSPPLCHPISMPINVQLKQQRSQPNILPKSHFGAINKAQTITNAHFIELPSTKTQSSTFMSTATPSIMHRLGKRPSSFNHCLLSLPSPNKTIKTESVEYTIPANHSNVISLNNMSNLNRKSNTIAIQPRMTTAFVTTTSNVTNERTQQTPRASLFQFVNPNRSTNSLMFSGATVNSTTPAAISNRNNQMVVLRTSLPPKIMRKVIGISPPRGPAGISPAIIPSNSTPPASNFLTDNLVRIM